MKKYSFSGGGRECSNALVVLLCRILLLALFVLLGARLLVLRRQRSVPQVGARLMHGGLRRIAGRDAVQILQVGPSIRLARASYTATCAAALTVPSRLSCSSAGSAPLSSAAARVAQPASVTWV